MNSQQIELPLFFAELTKQQDAIERQTRNSEQQVLTALKSWDRDEATRRFDLSLAWNKLHQFAADWGQSVSNASTLTYIAECWFLQDLIRHLTPGHDEAISHVTGTHLGNVRILSRICNLTAERKSPFYAKADPKNCADVEIEIQQWGNLLHAMGHCHPGTGASATRPSSIDVNYLTRIQKLGSEAIGIIVTRDGWVRFFTVLKPFQVLVTGNNVTQQEKDVFHVEIQDSHRD